MKKLARDFNLRKEEHSAKIKALEENFPKVWSNSIFPGVGVGWYKILWDLSKELEPICPEGFHFTDIKEKFGDLRIYYKPSTEDVRIRVCRAETRSSSTCEFCGSPGEKGGKFWIKTLCEECREVE